MYTVKKILNNNVVIGLNKDKYEVVLVGTGIGFRYKRGMLISEDAVTTIFTKKEDTIKNNYEKVLNKIDNEIVGVAEEMISMWEKTLETTLNDTIHISLPDHLSFALKRLKEEIKIENPFLVELKILFPKEVELAKEALLLFNSRFNVKFPEDEIGFICLHIRAALTNEGVKKSSAYMRKMQEIMTLISKLLNKDFNKDSLEYIRTVAHINFVYQRLVNNKPIKNHLLESIKKELFWEYNIALKVALHFDKLFNVKVPEDEVGYIALHLRRLKETEESIDD